MFVPPPEGYAAPPEALLGGLPIAWLDHRALHEPDRVAVEQDGSAWTYASLRSRTLEYTGAVLSRVAPGSCVGIVSPTNLEAYAALLGVMRAGCAALSFDAADGAARCATVLDDVEPALVLVDDPVRDLVGVGRPTLGFGEVDASCAGEGPALVAQDAARIIFTSGSTGRPSGFVLSHAAVADAACETVWFDRIHAGDRLGSPVSLAFSASTSQVLGALLAGAPLHQFDVHGKAPGEVLAWLGSRRLTWVKTTPAFLRTLLAVTVAPTPFGHLRVIRLMGDRALPSDITAAFAVLSPTCRIVVSYGSTDTGTVARRIVGPDERFPDGLPTGWILPGRTVRIDDDEGHPVAAGEVGHLRVRIDHPTPRRFEGPGRWGDVSAPLSDPVDFGDLARVLPDGQLQVVGRSNARVKLRGVGVDLIEVESAVRDLPGVTAVAAVVSAEPERPRLVIHVIASDAGPDAATVLDACRARLPAAAVPSLVRFWDRFPLTTRGKIDRAALAASTSPVGERPVVAPVGDLEAELLVLWRRVLDVPRLGVTDRFFDSGGDSLRAFELVALIEQSLGSSVSTASLLCAATVREQAAAIRAGRAASTATLVPLRAAGDDRGVYVIHGLGGSALFALGLMRGWPPDRSVWGLHLEDPERARAAGSVGALARSYADDVVRSNPRGPVTLVGWSYGGMLAWDVGRRLIEIGVPVGRVVIIDTVVTSCGPFDPDRSRLAQALFGARRLGWAVADLAGRAVADPSWAVRRLVGRARTGGRRVDPPEVVAVRHALQEISRGWVPEAATFPASVVSSDRRADAHRRVWGGATSGPCVVAEVRTARHLDLVTYRVRRTGRIIGEWLREDVS